MDVRELAIWHKGAKLLIIERTIQHLYHLRLSQAEHKDYESEINRLEERRESLLNGNVIKVPKTPEEQKQAMKEFAAALGLKQVKPEVKDAI
jgi:hypothetical protein